MIEKAAKYLFDNRLGWSDGRNPYAPRSFWYKLGVALYGENDERVIELSPNKPLGCPKCEEAEPVLHCEKCGYNWTA